MSSAQRLWIHKASSWGRRAGPLQRWGVTRGRRCWGRRPKWSCWKQKFPSECRSCDGMTTFSGCLHSLESQWCGNVTVVGRQWGAAGMLPPMPSHITRRSSTIGHVRWHLSWSRVRSHAGCWYKTAHSWETIWCLKGKTEETKENHIAVLFNISPVFRHITEIRSEFTVVVLLQGWLFFS